jgi:hypothetical protein
MLRKQGRSYVLLTVPHSPVSGVVGTSPSQHPYDYKAGPFARALAGALERAGFTVVVMYSTTPRSVIDLNRPTSMHTGFATEFMTRLTNDDVQLHLDIHSFPREDAKWAEYQVVQLTPVRQTEATSSAISALDRAFRDAGVRSTVVPGGNNFLINSASTIRAGTVTTLIEVREDTDTTGVLGAIVKWASGFVSRS